MELPGAVKSLKEIPRSAPVIVMVVLPSGGPDFGLKSEILGPAQSDPTVIDIALHTRYAPRTRVGTVASGLVGCTTPTALKLRAQTRGTTICQLSTIVENHCTVK